MDPVAKFVAQMAKEDRAVDNLNMKMNEERLKKVENQRNKLVEYIVEHNGCDKKEVTSYMQPGLNRPPLNVKMGEEKQKRMAAEDAHAKAQALAKGWHYKSQAMDHVIDFLLQEIDPVKSSDDDWLEKYRYARKNAYDNRNVPDEYRD